MEYRRLGGSGTRVSEIALGNWITHGGQIGDDAAKRCVEAALDAGINFFDTADIYERGKAETVIGNCLKGIERSSYVLATKLFWPMSEDPNDGGLSRKHIMESIDKSLRRLQTDYVDLYQAHRFDDQVPLEETVRAFDDVVRRGKALHIGVSEWMADQIADALRIADEMGFDRIVTNQPQYSMLWRVPEAEVMPLCREQGLGQIVWSPLAMGVLTGKIQARREARTGYEGWERRSNRGRLPIRPDTDGGSEPPTDRRRAGADDGGPGDRLGLAQRQRFRGHHRCDASRTTWRRPE
jgi:aryl-alcohol dehydrogenase-like predicted oxidoreductase